MRDIFWSMPAGVLMGLAKCPSCSESEGEISNDCFIKIWRIGANKLCEVC